MEKAILEINLLEQKIASNNKRIEKKYNLIIRKFDAYCTHQHVTVMDEISWMSESGYSAIELLEYIDEHYDELECEVNGEVYEEPKKHDRNLCIDCNVVKTIDYERSILVCTKCGVFEYYPVNVQSYNHTMRYSRRKCVYKRYDNFKNILDRFFYGGNKVVPDDVMEAIRYEIHDETNILYNYTIPLTIPILECILKRNKMMKYKNSIYFIFFKLSGVQFPCNTMKEYNSILNAFNVVSTIYDKYKPKGRKSFLNYSFVLKQILIVLGKNDYAKYIPQLKTNSKQKELERIWELITKDPEFAVALQKRKIV